MYIIIHATTFQQVRFSFISIFGLFATINCVDMRIRISINTSNIASLVYNRYTTRMFASFPNDLD